MATRRFPAMDTVTPQVQPSASHPIRTPAQLGPLMRALRKQAGLTQADMAEHLGITRQAITALERAPEAATFERLMKVWSILGLEVSLRQAGNAADAAKLEW